MSKAQSCRAGGPTKPNGNCTASGDDGLPVQCVGPWTKEKHDYLRRLIEATAGPRSKFLPPAGTGGAAFIDLFAGPGRARIRTSGEVVAGSPFAALDHATAPFTRVVLAELDPENAAALQTRTASNAARTRIVHGDCNATIDEIVAHVPARGLNIALIDAFNLRPLSFATIGKLARVLRMDLVINFPTVVIKRNFKTVGTYLTRFLGTESWKAVVTSAHDVPKLIDVLRAQLVTLGYEDEKVQELPITNRAGGLLYHLVYATKHPLGNKIWESVAKTTGTGQKTFGF